MIKRICDKCGREGNATMPLYRVKIIDIFDDANEDWTLSKLELCETCARRVIELANEVTPAHSMTLRGGTR